MSLAYRLVDTFVVSETGSRTVRNSALAAVFFAAATVGLKLAQDTQIMPVESARMTATYNDEKDRCVDTILHRHRHNTLSAELAASVRAGCARKALARAQSSSPGYRAAELGMTAGTLLTSLFVVTTYLAFALTRVRAGAIRLDP